MTHRRCTDRTDRAALHEELRQLATTRQPADPVRALVSEHAVIRYQERVAGVARTQARRRLQQLLTAPVSWGSRPRAWTSVVLHEDVVYGYPASRPDVCLLVREGVLVTVLSERFCRVHGRQPHRRARHDLDLLVA